MSPLTISRATGHRPLVLFQHNIVFVLWVCLPGGFSPPLPAVMIHSRVCLPTAALCLTMLCAKQGLMNCVSSCWLSLICEMISTFFNAAAVKHSTTQGKRNTLTETAKQISCNSVLIQIICAGWTMQTVLGFYEVLLIHSGREGRECRNCELRTANDIFTCCDLKNKTKIKIKDSTVL